MFLSYILLIRVDVGDLDYNSPICLSLDVHKLQAAVPARSSRENYLKLFVTTVILFSHAFAYQFGFAKIF